MRQPNAHGPLVTDCADDTVAEALKRTQTWVSNSELGERRVDFVEMEDFAALYDKPLEWFGTGTRKG